MIRPRYTLKLARTKLRSKRGMLLASTIIASLLFAALIACIIVFTAAEKSANDFIKKAGNDKYLVQVRPYIPHEVLGYTRDFSLEEIRGIKAFEIEYYNNLEEKYKAAGVAYDKSAETSVIIPDIFKSESLPAEQRVTIDRQSPVADAWFAKKLRDYSITAPNTLQKLKELGSTYGASGYYIQIQTPIPPLPSSRLIIDKKEDFSVSEMKRDGPTSYDSLINSAYNNYYQFQDDALLQRYLLTKDTSGLKGIPVIITSQEASSLFGKEFDIGKEPKDDSEKRIWLKNIQEKLNGHIYQACTRNSAEQTLLTKIQRDYAEIQNNKDIKDYKAPSLQHLHPATPCGDITIKQDTRTSAEKQLQAKAEEQQ
ncbi:MAG: hypothetical protein JWO55_207, partial [Candidatus Saccharibacteria bacterium]|nr:hypothetical protein [Candidatus Saccharibacteria bacterium]